ncbi:MAG: hypothetical protein ACYS99_02940, partial [Planctomycetota bacterium]
MMRTIALWGWCLYAGLVVTAPLAVVSALAGSPLEHGPLGMWHSAVSASDPAVTKLQVVLFTPLAFLLMGALALSLRNALVARREFRRAASRGAHEVGRVASHLL